MVRAALLTAWGTGGIAVIDLIGAAEHALGRLFDRDLPNDNHLVRGNLSDAAGRIDEVVAARLGPQRWRLTCHGGVRAVQRVLAALAENKVEIVTAQQLLAEAVTDGDDPLVAEIEATLPSATTRLAVRQLTPCKRCSGRSSSAAGRSSKP